MMRTVVRGFVLATVASGALLAQAPLEVQGQDSQGFKFRTGVELINVTATVTDASGRFVSGLTKDDFRVYDDNQPQAVTHFSSERVPVSLGLVLDTSGSMDGDKIIAAREALDRFLNQLLDPADEVFLYRFDSTPELVQGWTTNKRLVSDAVARMQPRGGTALYEAVVEAVQLAQTGHNRKKAIVIISDGNDTSSHIDMAAVKQLIRQTEVLAYAVGIDGLGIPTGNNVPVTMPVSMPLTQRPRGPGPGPRPLPLPFPMPGRRPPAPPPPQPPQGPSAGGSSRWRPNGSNDRVNVAALRDITDDSGGRTEIIRDPRDLDPATTGIADELSKQYYMGYPFPGAKDGRWHTIRVEVKGSYRIRARRGYMAATR